MEDSVALFHALCPQQLINVFTLYHFNCFILMSWDVTFYMYLPTIVYAITVTTDAFFLSLTVSLFLFYFVICPTPACFPSTLLKLEERILNDPYSLRSHCALEVISLPE